MKKSVKPKAVCRDSCETDIVHAICTLVSIVFLVIACVLLFTGIFHPQIA